MYALDVRLVRDRLDGADELRSQLQLLQHKLTAQADKSRELEGEARQLRDKLTGVDVELTAERQKHSTATAELRQKIADLEAQAQKIQQTAPVGTIRPYAHCHGHKAGVT